MRLVFALLFLTLVGIVVVAKLTPSSDQGSTEMTAALSDGPDAGATSMEPAATPVARQALDHVEEALRETPRSFPSELTRRSGVRPADAGDPEDAVAEADSSVEEGVGHTGDAAVQESAEGPEEAPTELPVVSEPTVAAVQDESTEPEISEEVTAVAVAAVEPTRTPTKTPTQTNSTEPGPEAETAERSATASGSRRGPVLRQPDDVASAPDPVVVEPAAAEGVPAVPAVPATAPEVETVPVVVPEAAPDAVAEAAQEPAANALPVQVTRFELRGTVSDTGGRGVPKISIAIVDVTTRAVLTTVSSGADGTFVARELPAGRVALVVDAKSVPLGIAVPVAPNACRNGDEPAGFGAPCFVLKAGAEQPLPADFKLPYSSGLQGTVKDKSGALVKGALVRAVARVEGYGDVRVLAKTDKDGFFFLSLVPGPYELQVLLPGDGPPEPRMRKQNVEAEVGSELVLDTIDFSKAVRKSSVERAEDASIGRSLDSARAAAVQPQPQPTAAPVSTLDSPVVAVAPARAESTAVRATTEASAEVTLDATATASSVGVELGAPTVERVERVEAAAVDGDPAASGSAASDTAAQTPAVDDPQGGDPEKGDSKDEAAADGVLLRGRVLSRWGEAVVGLDVDCLDAAGESVAHAITTDGGFFDLRGVKAGASRVVLGAGSKLERPNDQGVTLLKRPAPLDVVTFEGQRRVVLEDTIVDVKRTFRIAGKIVIDDDAFAAFKQYMIDRNVGLAKLDNQRFRRMYLRGMRLVQRNVGARGKRAKDRPVVVAPDGTFQWSCALPAEDVVFILEPRSGIPGPGYDGPVGVEVTPAGVRTAKLEIAYPPTR